MIRIDFSGIDGSGKTTMVNYAIEYLRSMILTVEYLKEVGHPELPACVKLREIFLDPTSNLSGEAVEFICAAMRFENEKILSRFEAEDTEFVISDRGYLDHLAYGDVNCSIEFMNKLFHGLVAQYTPAPDYIFYFSISSEEANKRRVRRAEAVDAIEAKGLKFLDDVSERFDIRAMELPVGCELCFINADESLEQVKAQVRDYIDAIIYDNITELNK